MNKCSPLVHSEVHRRGENVPIYRSSTIVVCTTCYPTRLSLISNKLIMRLLNTHEIPLVSSELGHCRHQRDAVRLRVDVLPTDPRLGVERVCWGCHCVGAPGTKSTLLPLHLPEILLLSGCRDEAERKRTYSKFHLNSINLH